MESHTRIFLRLISKFDLATSFFRSFELFTIKQILKNMEINAPILDLGCAEGNIGREVFLNNKIYGLDYELKYLLAAKKLVLYKSVIAADAAHLPFKDSSFQCLFSNSVLEHIKQLDEVLNEVKRVLKPGGVFLFTVPNDSFHSQLFFNKLLRFFRFKKWASLYSEERNRRLDHFHLYSQQSWAKIIAKSGLCVTSMKDYLPGPALMLWDLIAAFQFLLQKIFGVFLNVPLLKNFLLLIAYILKIVFACVLLPFFGIINNKDIRGCATAIIVSK